MTSDSHNAHASVAVLEVVRYHFVRHNIADPNQGQKDENIINIINISTIIVLNRHIS